MIPQRLKQDDLFVDLVKGIINTILFSLRGIAQVILIGNAFAGFLILLAFTIISLQLGFIILFSSILGTVIGGYFTPKRDLLEKGLLGFNAVLTAIGLSTFLSDNLVIICISVIFTTIITVFMMNKIRYPVLTFPFVIVTWIVLLAFSTFDFPTDPLSVNDTIRIMDFGFGASVVPTAVIKGISQVYVSSSLLVGACILVALWISGWRNMLFAIIGSCVGYLVSVMVLGDKDFISNGMYGYNAVLTMLGLSSLFQNNVKIGILGAFTSVFIMAFCIAVLTPYNLPPLTMPFVLTTWSFIAIIENVSLAKTQLIKGGD